MPKTFRDAVTATRELGIRYLWIDSLCIIQDSAEDWETECSRMADIYQGSVVTICGPSSPDSTSGFLNPRTCPESVPRLWEYRNSSDTSSRRAIISVCIEQSEMSNSRDYPDKPWLTDNEQISTVSNRSWILQEYLLSARILFFGAYRMHWECNTCVRFEDFASLQESRDDGFHCAISKTKVLLAKENSSSTDALLKAWRRIVKEYTRRSLTDQRDKLPAFSDIAAWLLSGSQDQYLAGLLKRALREGLLWFVDRSSPASRLAVPSCVYRAPSWSWASSNYPVDFRSLYHRPSLNAINANSSHRQPRNFSAIEFHDADVHTRSQNPFGEVTSGSIKLRGRVRIGIIPGRRSRMDGASSLILRDPLTGEGEANFFPDDLSQWGLLPGAEYTIDKPRRIECLCVAATWPGWVGIAIERLSQGAACSGTHPPDPLDKNFTAYRRIGFIEHELFAGSYYWFIGCPWEQIELF